MNRVELVLLAACRRLLAVVVNDPLVQSRLSGVKAFVKVDDSNRQLFPKEVIETVKALIATGTNPCTMRKTDLRDFMLQRLPDPALATVAKAAEKVRLPGLEPATVVILHDRLRALRKQVAQIEARDPNCGGWDNLDRLLREVECISGLDSSTPPTSDHVTAPLPWPRSTSGLPNPPVTTSVCGLSATWRPSTLRQPEPEPPPNRNAGEADHYLVQLFDRMWCKLGRHEWVQDCATVKDDVNGRHVALGWSVCCRCSESKLTLILR